LSKLGGLSCALLAVSAPASSQSPEQGATQVPIVVTAPGGLYDQDEAQGADAAAIRGAGHPDVLEALSRSIPGLSLQDAQGNSFEPNLVYRGFTVSPLQGQPQGLAVYVDGVRFNQPFGDTVHFELLPSVAIRRADLFDASAIYGLNALGGALVIETKTGRTAPGVFMSAGVGDYGRPQATAEVGWSGQRSSIYFAVQREHDSGWRRFSPSNQANAFADVGWDGRRAGIHLKADVAHTNLTGNGPAPVQLLAADRRAVFTVPDTGREKYLRTSLHPWIDLGTRTRVEASLYWQEFRQGSLNGDAADIASCETDAKLLCLHDASGAEALLQDTTGQTVASASADEYGLLNRSRTDTKSTGILAQLTYRRSIRSLPNTLVIGFSYDNSRTDFQSNSELGALDDNRVVRGLGPLIAQPDATITPVSLIGRNRYTGAFLSDRLAFAHSLRAELGLRWNDADTELHDLIGTALDGHHAYQRLNPGVQIDWQAAPGLDLRAGYSEADRSPTPAELSCADPKDPCSFTDFFLADPPLKHVVARSLEIGGQGRVEPLQWLVTAYRTTTTNDIQFVASMVRGRGYFRNVGATTRQGIEATLGYRKGFLSVRAGYAYTDARFETPFALNSPDNPAADASGQIYIERGDKLPGVPKHRALLSADYDGRTWTIGGDLQFASGQYFFGDEANLQSPTRGYAVANLRASIELNGPLHLFGEVRNLFDARYATYATFSQTDQIFLKEAPNAANPRSISPGAPRRWIIGLKTNFG
jgi:iron complex outermembrane recepter protein